MSTCKMLNRIARYLLCRRRRRVGREHFDARRTRFASIEPPNIRIYSFRPENMINGAGDLWRQMSIVNLTFEFGHNFTYVVFALRNFIYF